jgi:multisubunit Na+/H+ antiporter MnhF subunit
MKRDLYDNSEYQAEVAQRRKEGKKKDSYYGQLNRLRSLMLWAIIVAFFNAGIQVLYGNTNQDWLAALCFLVTGTSWILVLACLMVVSHNLKEMIVISEKIARKRELGEPPPE